MKANLLSKGDVVSYLVSGSHDAKLLSQATVSSTDGTRVKLWRRTGNGLLTFVVGERRIKAIVRRAEPLGVPAARRGLAAGDRVSWTSGDSVRLCGTVVRVGEKTVTVRQDEIGRERRVLITKVSWLI